MPSPSARLADTADSDSNETFAPLALDRVVDSVGFPEGGERVSIFGEGMQPGARVFFGSTEASSVLVLDDTQINATVPEHARGLVDVRVDLLDAQSVVLEDAYFFRGPLELYGISSHRSRLAGGDRVTLTGEGFARGLKVFVGTRQLGDVEVIDETTLTGVLPARLHEDPTLPVDVVVSNGLEQRILDRAFRYTRPLEVRWAFPAVGSVRGGTELTLYGFGFEAETVAYIDGVVAETVVAGHGRRMTIRTPPSRMGQGRVADIELVHDLERVTLSDAFAYVADAPAEAGPALVNIWPGAAPTYGGTQVALAITGFDAPPLTVTFGGVEAQIIEARPTDGLVVVAVPEVAGPGAVDVVVSSGGGGVSATMTQGFTYQRGVRVDAVSPNVATTAGGTFTLTGDGMDAVETITVAGVQAEITDRGLGTLTARSAASVVGRVDIVLTSADGVITRMSGAYGYRSDGDAKMWAITPGSGAQSGGRIVRVLGEGFGTTNPLPQIGDTLFTDRQVVDDGLLLLRAPAGEVGRSNVRASGLGLLPMAYQRFDPTAAFGGTGAGDIPEALNITVRDLVTGEGVEGAYVILWDDLDTPYQGITDARGQVTFSDVGFGPLQMVTAGADNYTTASIVEFDARDATLLLIPLVSSPPGGGGGGGGQTLPDGILSGKVTGLDKYVQLPPGDCNSRLGVGGNPALCQACEDDGDCSQAGATCTPLGDQGYRCATSCSDDSGCPEGFACTGVAYNTMGCVPIAGKRVARCDLTVTDVFVTIDGTPLAVNTVGGVFSIDSPPGEYAVVCMGGYDDFDTGEFVPLMMGVRRHVFLQPGDLISQQDVRLDIPLNRDLRIRLDEAPTGDPRAAMHTVDVFLDLGSDGVYLMPSRGQGIDQNDFTLEHFPARFEESLYDASYTFYATAVADVAAEEQTGEGSYTLHTQVTEIDDETVYTLTDDGLDHRQSGLNLPIHRVTRLDTPAGPRLWAASDGGRVLSYGGGIWGLQQLPTRANLSAVWADSEGDIWAVGDAGVIGRYNGLTWDLIAPPAGLEALNWRGIARVDGELWLWTESTVWRLDPATSSATVVSRLDVAAAIQDTWSDGAGEAWVVGDGGMIRRLSQGVVTQMDQPGADFLAVDALDSEVAWAVGRGGRITRWDGYQWFDYLPITRRDLRAVYVVSEDLAWAVGDAGLILKWDGVSWAEHATLNHIDLMAVVPTSDGLAQVLGRHTLVLGPFMQLPRTSNPTATGVLLDLNLRWHLEAGADASFNWVELQHESGFPFWTIMAEGKRTSISLPDLRAAWGLQALWPGANFLQIVRVYAPDFDIDAYDRSLLSREEWRSWSVTAFGLQIPEE